MTTRDPILTPVPIKDLRPTQITVGFREVGEKRKLWRRRSDEKAAQFLIDEAKRGRRKPAPRIGTS